MTPAAFLETALATRRAAVLAELETRDWFDITSLSVYLSLGGAPGFRDTPEFQALQAVHCLRWDDMSTDLAHHVVDTVRALVAPSNVVDLAAMRRAGAL